MQEIGKSKEKWKKKRSKIWHKMAKFSCSPAYDQKSFSSNKSSTNVAQVKSLMGPLANHFEHQYISKNKEK